MVNININVSDDTNQVLNIVKAKYNLKDKSEAVQLVVSRYSRELLEPELKPGFVEKIQKGSKGKTIRIGSTEDFAKRYD